MDKIFLETDYRVILREFYNQQKNVEPKYSFRTMGEKLGLDGSQLFRVLKQKQHLPGRCVLAAKELMELSGRAADYFDILFALSTNRNSAVRKDLMDKASELRDVALKNLEGSEVRFIRDWWIPVVRAYLDVSKGRANPLEISARIFPKINPSQVEEAIEVLKEIGFVKRLPSGRWGLKNAHLSVGGPEKAEAVRAFQKQAMMLGVAAIEEIPVEERDISSLTVSVDKESFEEIRELAKEFRRQVQKSVEKAVNPDRVMQVTVSIFPSVRAQKDHKDE